VAATKSAKNPTPHNDTPNTPKVREGAIAKMKVDELRHKLRGHGVKGTADLKKPELVKQLIKAEVAATKKSAKPATAKTSAKSATAKTSAKPAATAKSAKPATTAKSAKPATGKKSAPATTKKAAAAATKTATATKPAGVKKATVSKKSAPAKASAKNPTPGNDTPNTPDVSETAIAGLKVDELRRKLRGHGVKGTAELKKPELVKQLTKLEVAGAKKKAARKK
jgi:hypothetical protein